MNSKTKERKSIIQGTESGSLFITVKDLLGQDKAKAMIKKLVESPVFNPSKETYKR
jgi:hypothetical protein